MKYKIEERQSSLYNYACDKRIWVIRKNIKFWWASWWEDYKIFYNKSEAEKSLEKLNQLK